MSIGYFLKKLDVWGVLFILFIGKDRNFMDFCSNDQDLISGINLVDRQIITLSRLSQLLYIVFVDHIFSNGIELLNQKFFDWSAHKLFFEQITILGIFISMINWPWKTIESIDSVMAIYFQEIVSICKGSINSYTHHLHILNQRKHQLALFYSFFS